MLKTLMRLTVLMVMCVLLSGHAGAAERAAAGRTVSGAAIFTGELKFALVDDAVELTARGDGWAAPWAGVAAEATWTPAVNDVLALLAGQVDELTIRGGTFAAGFNDGDSLRGTIAGTVCPRGDGTFALKLKFTATGGTGAFRGATGGGTLYARGDASTSEFRAILHARMTVPR